MQLAIASGGEKQSGLTKWHPANTFEESVSPSYRSAAIAGAYLWLVHIGCVLPERKAYCAEKALFISFAS